MIYRNKKAQEEMVGFAMIIVLVFIILLAFLGFSLSKSKNVPLENYEVENFLQAALQYTTDCQTSLDYLSVQDLIFSCEAKEQCLGEKDSCEALNSSLNELFEKAWPIGEDRPNKGYEFSVETGEEPILYIKEGNLTKNYKGASQIFSKRRKTFNIIFKIYS